MYCVFIYKNLFYHLSMYFSFITYLVILMFIYEYFQNFILPFAIF